MDISKTIANISTGTSGVALVEITSQFDFSKWVGLAIGIMTVLIQFYNAHQGKKQSNETYKK